MSKYPEPPPPCPRCKDASHITITYGPERYQQVPETLKTALKYWCRNCEKGFD